MPIIYSYPEGFSLLPGDLFIYTSAVVVGGKTKHKTKNVNFQNLAGLINLGNTLQTVTDNGNVTTNNIRVSKDGNNSRVVVENFNDQNASIGLDALGKPYLKLSRNDNSDVTLSANLVTTSRLIEFPNASGTLALLSNVSGTLNYVPKFGTSGLVQSLIYDDGVSVGIGSISLDPDIRFYVSENSGGEAIVGEAVTGRGLKGVTFSGSGVFGTADSGIGVLADTFSGIAFYGNATQGQGLVLYANGDFLAELNLGNSSDGLIINSGASSSGDVIKHDKNGFINFKVTQAGNVTANSFIKTGGLSTQYLKADGSVSTLTNPVTGTGTTNVIPKFTGASTLGNSSLSDDGTFVTSTIDLKINGVTVGRGGGSITSNTALGSTALIANTSGTSNVAVGREALSKNTTGLDNTAVGVRALLNNTLGQANTAIGKNNMQFNVSGTKNTSIGYESLNQNSSGFNNTALGYQALYFTSTASANLGSGYKALYSNTTGSNNVAVGSESLSNTSAAIQNTSIGAQALVGMLTGDKNVAVGFNAGRYIGSISTNTSSSNSIFIGFQTKPLLTGQSNQIVIGYDTTGNGTNTTTIGNFNVLQTYIRGEVIVGGATPTGSSKLKVDGSIRVQDDTAGASSTNVGALRYRKTGNNSYVEMCMQTAATTYAWTVIVEQNW